jgi:hypothetical protein
MNQTDDTTLKLYALWTVDNATEVVNDAADKGGGTALTLTGVAWDDIKDVVESALSGRVTTLNLAGVSGFEEEWGKDTLTNKGNIAILTLPETVTTLVDGTGESDYAFYGYTKLESVSGAGVTDVGVGAFNECTALKTVSLKVATEIGDGAFFQCTGLTEVSLPAAMDIGDDAFFGCAALKTVSLPEAKTIGDDAFFGCTALTTVSLPAAKEIGDDAFRGCTALTTVSLPAATEIGDGAFDGCTDLTSLTLPATPPKLGEAVFMNTGSGTLLIHVGSGNVSAYESAWSEVSSTDNTKTIEFVEQPASSG